jgi:hypothetical protein
VSTETNTIEDNVSKLLRKVASGSETVFDIKQEGDVRRVEIIRRQVKPEMRTVEAPIARDQARAYVFHDLDSFSDFCNRECDINHSVILADVDAQKITAVLDSTLPTGREVIAFEAKIHPLFAPWMALLNRPIPVLEFALFAQRYRRSIVAPNGRDLAMMFSQIKVSKSIEINKGMGAKALNGIMISTEIAGAKKDALVELPEEIHLLCPIFIGSEPHTIELDILVTEAKESIVVYLTSPLLDELRIKAFENMVKTLQEACNELLIGMGKADFRPWVTVSQTL